MHALIDFSDVSVGHEQLASALSLLSQADSIAGLATDVTCVVPSGTPMPAISGTRWRWTTLPGVAAARTALTRAGRSSAHLLVLSAPVTTAAEVATSLSATFACDPLFGAVHPRFARHGGGAVLPVFGSEDRGGEVPRRALLDLPATYILPEYVSRCFVLRNDLLANLGVPDSHAATIGQMLLAYLRKARRVGFRSVVVNTVVLNLPDRSDEHTEVPAAAAAGQHSDTATARSRFARRVDLARERRLAALHESRPRVLIDAGNLGSTINGTTKAFFGLADALHDHRPAWSITLLVSDEVAESHAIAARYPEWNLAHVIPQETFAAAFRPSQPWDLSELVGLHRVAAVNVFLMLDTISWDVVYTAPSRLDATWRFAAQYADALLFISDFSRQRFVTRFPVHPDVRADVCHLSLDPADYIDGSLGELATQDPFWFVIGNQYDHKHLQPTLALLARAFPTTRLAVLGAPTNGRQVTGIASGRSDEHHVQALYAGAELVVFPSMYEGFGLPVVNALAYGRTVVARDSALLREIADAYVGPGRIVPFTTPDELVERLSHLRHALAVPEVQLGSGKSVAHGWQSCARSVEACINDLMRPRTIRRERDRHETVLLLDSWERGAKSDNL